MTFLSLYGTLFRQLSSILRLHPETLSVDLVLPIAQYNLWPFFEKASLAVCTKSAVQARRLKAPISLQARASFQDPKSIDPTFRMVFTLAYGVGGDIGRWFTGRQMEN